MKLKKLSLSNSIEQYSENAWYDYCKNLAAQGFFCGFVSPDETDLGSLDKLFEVWDTPVRYFGNMVFVCVYRADYRIYQVLYPGVVYSWGYYYGFNSDGSLEFVWCSDIHSLCLRKESVLSAQEVTSELYQLINLDDANYRIMLSSALKSYRGCPLYIDRTGRVHDILRGYSSSSFGDVASIWLGTEFHDKLITCVRSDYSDTCCFLMCADEEQIHTLFPILFHDCMFFARNSWDCSVAFIPDVAQHFNGIHCFAVYAACIAIAYDVNPPAYRVDWAHSRDIEYAQEIAELLVGVFKEAGVKVTQTGPWEFKLGSSEDDVAAGGYEPS